MNHDQKIEKKDSTITNNSSNLNSITENNNGSENYVISNQNIPSLNKILVTYDGKEESNRLLGYAISLSNYSGAELLILRILEDIEKMEDVSVKGTGEGSDTNNHNTNHHMEREIQGEIIDEMERKIKKCKEAGCKNEISYKFRTGNVTDEISNEVKDGNYDLVILRSSGIDSWMKSLFSDTRKIMSNINVPVLLV